MILVLFIPRDTGLAAHTICEWTLFDRSHRLLREGKAALADIPKAEKVILCLPANRVLYTQVRLPAVSAARRASLLRYAIEDKLTTDPAAIHAVLYAASGSEADSVVAAMDRTWLRSLLDLLAAQKLNVVAAVDEAQALPVEKGAWALRCERNETGEERHGYAVRPDGYAYGFDLDNGNAAAAPPFSLTLALSEARKQSTAPASLNVYGDLPPGAQWQQSLALPVHYKGEWSRQQMAAMLISRQRSANLLTGEFVPRSSWAARE